MDKKLVHSSNVLVGFLTIINQVKLYHWQTLLHPRHVSTDMLHKKLSELVDNFIEALTGRNIVEFKNPIYRVKLNKPDLQLIYYDDNEGITLLDQIKLYLEKDISLLEVIKNNTDLSNIRDEMLGHINNTIYLFSLK